MKSTNVLKLLLGVLLVVLLVTFTCIGLYDSKSRTYTVKSAKDIVTGLDISGGVSIVYKPDTDKNVSTEEMGNAKTILRERLDNKGLYDANIKVDLANNWLEVEIPNETNPDEAVAGLGQTAVLQFRDPDGNVVLEGQDVQSAVAETVQNNMGVSEYAVSLKFSEEGTAKFAEATTNLVGKSIYIYLDENIISAPVVNEPITNGSCYISMNGTSEEILEEASTLANLINSGSLPFGLTAITSEYVGPTVGEQALNISIKAAFIGIILVMIYMIVIYKLPGFVADIALVAYTSVVLLLISNLGITLTLSGIAGIILSIGMAVDANVIIFERIKEEINAKRSIAKSIDLGFKNAVSSIVDGNVTTAIVALALYFFGTGSIKGFGAVLLIGVIVSMLTAVFFTRFLMNTVSKLAPQNKKLYGGKAND